MLSLLKHIVLLEQQLLKLLFRVKVADEYLLTAIATVVHKESDDSFGHTVVDILLYNIEVADNEALYHVSLSLLPHLRVVVHPNHPRNRRQHVPWQLVVLSK